MTRHWISGLWLLCTVLLGGPAARADVRIGFGETAPSFYPIDTYYSDSRFQFIIPKEELRLESGESISSLSLYLDSSVGYSVDQLFIRLKNATQTDLDSMNLSRFVNGGLTLCRQSVAVIPNTPGWVLFSFSNNHSFDSSRDLLVDLVMNKSVQGNDSYWSTVATTEPCLRTGIYNSTPSFNLLGTNVGVVFSRRPLVKLGGAKRRMPALVANASQLVDPDGLLHADWKVSGRRTTILPGVTLNFAAGYGLQVYDDFRAIGSEADSIRFTGVNWTGIYAAPESDAQVELSHCVVEHTRTGVNGLTIYGGATGGRHSLHHLRVRDCPGAVGLSLSYSPLDLSHIRVEGCATGLYLYGNSGTMEDLELVGNGLGLRLWSLGWDGPALMRRVLISESPLQALSAQTCTMTLEDFTLRDNAGTALHVSGASSLELVNCVLDNPATPAEVQAESGSFVALTYGVLPGGAARCTQDGLSQVVLGAGLLDADPLLDAQHRPLAGSPVIDAGSLLSAADPDLTPADIGYHYYDQSAPVASAAVDVPEDQGGRLQLVWNASSMDLAQANGDWFYSLWRLDTLFSAAAGAPAALPVVHTRSQAEAAMETGAAFTWERDGSAWSWLGSLPAARHAQYAQVVETLADRLDGQPWPTQLKVLWHAGAVLSESEVLTGTSLDNVPPDAPQLLATLAQPAEGLLLGWQPVTTGTVNGQHLPERNGVRYHVYEIPTPWAPASAGTLLGTTSEPLFLLPQPVGNEKRFYRVRADDQF
ncbi:MAG: hypothetical protein WC326_03975 [Candidatus Delongbacteria bacterium]